MPAILYTPKRRRPRRNRIDKQNVVDRSSLGTPILGFIWAGELRDPSGAPEPNDPLKRLTEHPAVSYRLLVKNDDAAGFDIIAGDTVIVDPEGIKEEGCLVAAVDERDEIQIYRYERGTVSDSLGNLMLVDLLSQIGFAIVGAIPSSIRVKMHA